ncbi:uncharacterized protein LOC116341109 [Contarinia nasturtii]|uniref:uncharacterized protein LOC116341109 n=1 Tax=Contarinia nasturtii TaxID=265458 RepID=UPI0012D3A831|nr:uncharacterized protein LOC116341109 [Contarinia nasturtii]
MMKNTIVLLFLVACTAVHYTQGVPFSMQTCKQHFQQQIFAALNPPKTAKLTKPGQKRTVDLWGTVNKAMTRCYDWAQYNKGNRSAAAQANKNQLSSITKVLRAAIISRQPITRATTDYCMMCQNMLTKKTSPTQLQKFLPALKKAIK